MSAANGCAGLSISGSPSTHPTPFPRRGPAERGGTFSFRLVITAVETLRGRPPVAPFHAGRLEKANEEAEGASRHDAAAPLHVQAEAYCGTTWKDRTPPFEKEGLRLREIGGNMARESTAPPSIGIRGVAATVLFWCWHWVRRLSRRSGRGRRSRRPPSPRSAGRRRSRRSSRTWGCPTCGAARTTWGGTARGSSAG